MRLAYVLLLSVVACAVASAAPDGADDKPWAYPDGFVQFRTEYNEQEPNDTCPGPLGVTCGDVVYGVLGVAGDHDWFPLTITDPVRVFIGTDMDPNNPADTDTYLELWDGNCGGIIAEDDDGGPPSWFSLIVIDLDPGDYNIKVRGYADVATGPYMMFVTCEEPPPPVENDTCELAEENGYFIDRCTAGSLNGDASTAANDYSPGSTCTGYSVDGLDVVYVMDLNAGDVCDFVYTSWDCDGAFFIMTDCSDPTGSCVVGADDTLTGDPESILGWTVPATGRYYLVLDNWSFECGGSWTLDYVIECGCDCEVVITDVLDLGNGRCKYLFYGMTDCNVVNDFHLDLLEPGWVTLIGCSVPPESSWYCDIDGDAGHWWTDTNEVPPGENMPLMDLVVDWNVAEECVPFLARFTLDGEEICSTEICFDNCVPPVATEETSWGQIKSMFK